MKRSCFFPCLLIFLFFLSSVSHAGDETGLTEGQTIYVPAYSHIYIGSTEKEFSLTITLSIRNIDLDNPIEITIVDYYETQGKLLKKYLNKPITLKPLESLRYVIPEKDKSGGSGANFIVEWKSDKPVNLPIVECIMIGAKSTQGISFVSRGREIHH
ncbi:MAG: DUF3124 domain-containing protein [Desulfobacteraceae bacterium]|nr:MAG: DUF3124 domain-containing protein [Desulfobacteraceae bacterium]